MPTQKVCSFCKENIGVATKTCKHCGTKQPAKERLEKKKEKFTAEWKERQKKNCSINKVYDATNLLLHKWNLLERHPVLFLSKKTKNGIVAEFLCPRDIEAEEEEVEDSLATMQQIYEKLLNGHDRGTPSPAGRVMGPTSGGEGGRESKSCGWGTASPKSALEGTRLPKSL
ncbi:hypothetical protein D9C73_025283 [Collichthys lucidus]|uniref:Uncharacterized protein n=1 Tax=Collichthys lucidus TaxID=240159 RepID=A0A4U5VRR9_COLLU|nr:hypothetical protein D9C73_025283 [Collichthys lucidus]